jgi:PhzF family phenazine biosynthesis protein
MKIKLYQIDAFTDRLFSGNPAAVCPLNRWLRDDVLQNIAMENNLAETAFYVKKDDVFEIRWFTPTVEVDLCGHATLASAHVLFNYEKYNSDEIEFYSPRSGKLVVSKNDEMLTLNFPTDTFTKTPLTPELTACFDVPPIEAYKGKTDYMLVFENQDQIENITPHLDRIAQIPARGFIVTARGNEVDFVSRFFGPASGINEDPVTGSAHTTLTPYWHTRTGKTEMSAIQLSPRRGYLTCTHLEGRVAISGQAKMYLRGEIELD